MNDTIVKIEILRSTHDPKYWALEIGGIRHGVDAGPWKTIKEVAVNLDKVEAHSRLQSELSKRDALLRDAAGILSRAENVLGQADMKGSVYLRAKEFVENYSAAHRERINAVIGENN